MRKLFKFGAYANSLDHLDCSLAVFYNENFISGRKFLSSSMKTVVGTCSCAISLDHLDFRLLCLAHIATRNQDEFTAIFFRDGSSTSYFSRKLFELGAYANSLDHLDCSLAVLYNKKCISGSKFLSSSMKAVVGTCSCAISLDHLDSRLFMFCSQSYAKSG